jgi:ABC-type branched-subunit amino acid transport system substrate-binding protein
MGCTAGPSDRSTDTPARREASRTETIAFLFDGSPDDADLVTGPALAGLELAARRAGVEVEPVNVGEDPEQAAELLAALGDDHGVIAAVVAPWTAPPAGATRALAAAGIPVVSLSWAWGPAPAGGSWRSLVVDEEMEATLLLDAAADVGSSGPACVSGDGNVTGRSLTSLLERLSGAQGELDVRQTGAVDPGRPTTADAVAGRLDELRCGVLLWTGGVEGASLLARSIPPPIIGTSKLKNDEALTVSIEARAQIDTVCGCADVTLTRRPSLQRFVHDFQADSAGAPGTYAVEAYDAGRMLLELLEAGTGTREDLAARMGALDRLPGLVRTYRFGSDGSLASEIEGDWWWRADGSRWLPVRAPEP